MNNNKDSKTNSSSCNPNSSNKYIDFKLNSFSYADFVLLSSTLAYGIGEELNDTDLDLVIVFLSMISSDLALIRTKRGILKREQALQKNSSNSAIDIITTEAEDVVISDLSRKSSIKKKKIYKKKKRKKQLY